jgi:6-pyruvoyl-tetrahydropterin synthase
MALPADLHFRLSVFGELKASHTLEGHPIPHFHLWKIAVELGVPHPLRSDRVLDLLHMQSVLDEILQPLKNAHLNDHAGFGLSPTCENLCIWIWEQWQNRLPDGPLSSITTVLCDLEGRPTGQASLGR